MWRKRFACHTVYEPLGGKRKVTLWTSFLVSCLFAHFYFIRQECNGVIRCRLCNWPLTNVGTRRSVFPKHIVLPAISNRIDYGWIPVIPVSLVTVRAVSSTKISKWDVCQPHIRQYMGFTTPDSKTLRRSV